MAATVERLILASASTARRALLKAAGVEFTVFPAEIDEDELKLAARRQDDSPLACAAALAASKATTVSRLFEGLVIGADQILAADDEWYDKPQDLAAAVAQLRALRGRRHILATAVCVAQDDKVLWQTTSTPELEMRWFSDGFIERYIAAEGEAVLGSVGAYRLEGLGVQLFARINGDQFAVLGLPLLELLGFLRERGVIST